MSQKTEIPREAQVYLDNDAPEIGHTWLTPVGMDGCPVCGKGVPQYREQHDAVICGCGAVFEGLSRTTYVEHREPWAKNVLISASRDDLEHKMYDEIGWTECYWTVNGTPRQTAPGWEILFAEDGRVFGKNEILRVEEGKIWFDALLEADEPVPKDPPTRGFTYVNPPERPGEQTTLTEKADENESESDS